MSDEQLLLLSILRLNFSAFIRKAFNELNPASRFHDSWFIDHLAYRLSGLRKRERQRLTINMPPRHLKSTIVSVALVAWLIGHDPTLRIIVVSYSDELAETLARDFRRLVSSKWYRALFPGVRIGAKDSVTETVTTMGGFRLALSVGGSLTGRGADLIIVDDPMKAQDMHSESKRKAVIDFYRNVLVSRLNNPNEGSILVVMQRLHEDDLSGYLRDTTEFDSICLPAIALVEQTFQIGPEKFHIRRPGDVLSPAVFSREALDRIKAEQGPTIFEGQYQQSPVPHEGNTVNREWVNIVQRLPEDESLSTTIMSCDTAIKTGDSNDYSAICVFHIYGEKIYLVHVERGRWPYDVLADKVRNAYNEFNPDHLLIEDKGSGSSLIGSLKSSDIFATPVTPLGNKEERVLRNLAPFETRRFHVLESMSNYGEYMIELLGFPNVRHDDMVDCTTQVLDWLKAHRVDEPDLNFIFVTKDCGFM